MFSNFILVIPWILYLQLESFECKLTNLEVDTKLRFHGYNKSQVFIFSTNSNNWKYYDWSKITTIVEFGYHDDALIDFAHENGVFVSYAANFNKLILYNTSAIDIWTTEQINYMIAKRLDGINIDFEDEINCTDVEARNNFIILMRLMRIKMKNYKSSAQLSIDFAWSPSNIDNRCYDYTTLSETSDLVFIMAYDERSQIFGPCVAWANSPYQDTVRGIKSFHDIGIPFNKIVLGVPWYGYDYDCISYHKESNTCWMRKVPFRGVPCSDAAGTQVGYSDILIMLNSSIQIREGDDNGGQPKELKKNSDYHKIKIVFKDWDVTSASPYFTYLDLEKQVYHQVWHDDFISLSLKYSFARSYGLAGVGVWNADSVRYDGDGIVCQATKEMWQGLPNNWKMSNHL